MNNQENPYLPPDAALAELPTGGAEHASRGVRLAATLLDGVFVGLAVFIGMMPAMLAGPSQAAAEWSMVGMLLVFVGVVTVNAILVARNGQTLGKYLLKIRVVRADGSNAGLTRIFFARYLPVTVLGAVPLLGIIVSLADALMIFRDNRRCLHDEIADTIVVRA